MEDRRKISRIDYTALELGKMPPQSIDLEEALLCVYMINENCITDTISIIKPSVFYKDAHQKICQAIFDLYSDRKPVDVLTVADNLRKKGTLDDIGGPFYLTQISTNQNALPGSAEYYSKVISQNFVKREYIRISSDIQQMAFDESIDMEDLIEYTEKNIFAISMQLSIKEPLMLKESMPETLNNLKLAQERALNNEFTGVPFGLKKLDEITGGGQNTDLIILAARPAMGKTSVAISFAKSAAMNRFPVLVFSCEMSNDQLNQRLISGETDYSPTDLRTGNFDNWDSIKDSATSLGTLPIIVDETPNIYIFELLAKARRAKQKHKIGIIVIDYIQLISVGKGFNGNREQEVSTISRQLKGLAKELKVPIIALSQLNRELEKRPDKRPKMSDLRESGAIEQDADMVMFIHRPSEYKEDVMPIYNGNEFIEVDSNGLGLIIIGKHRHGSLGDIVFTHDPAMTNIGDYRTDVVEEVNYDFYND